MRIFLVFICLWMVSCNNEKPSELLVFQGNAFGTSYAIQAYSNDREVIEKGLDSVFYRVNKSVSTYMPESDISKINKGDTTVVVDAIFKEVFRISEMVYTNSNGYFDPTVGVLRNAYGFGETRGISQLEGEKLDSLRQLVGFTNIKLLGNGTIVKKHPHMYLDFNAVAKGYGIDCVGAFLESLHIKNFVIELGGEVLAKGVHPVKMKPWRVGVEALDSKAIDQTAVAVVNLSDLAMAGSGNYRKFRIDTITGKKYVHTINPLTGLAEANDVTSATILAKTCGEADAYATACMALGIEKAKKMLATVDGVEAYLTFTNAENENETYITDGFKALLD